MEKRKVFSRIGWGLLLIFVMGQLVVLAMTKINPLLIEQTEAILAATNVGMYVIAFPLVLWWLRKAPRIEAEEKRKIETGKLIKLYFIAAGVANLINIVYGIISVQLTGEHGNVVGMAIEEMSLIPLAILLVGVAPIMEEVVFRKMLYTLLAVYGKKVFIVVSAIVFALFHMNLGQALYAFWLGLILAWVYAETRQVKYCIILHMVINFMGGLAPVMLWESKTGEAVLVGIVMFTIVLGLSMFIVMIRKQRKSENSLVSDEVAQPIKIGSVFQNAGMIVYSAISIIMMVVTQILMNNM